VAFVVPFDGSDLAETALVRAREFSEVLAERVVAVTVVPRGNTEYARDQGWIGHDEPFEMETVVTTLHRQALGLVTDADFNHIVVDKYAPAGTIASRLRRFAKKEDASMVFIGSDNAGRMVTGVGSVGASVGAEQTYDVVIIRNTAPSKVAEIQEKSPYKQQKSDFYR
jgi:nucleotide-binding universal stress UspA family protein